MDILLSLLFDQVDEIMMTLKQAFTVAAVQQTAKAPAQLCEGCPLQSLHKLCERIEGEQGPAVCDMVGVTGPRQICWTVLPHRGLW